jgi:hypothetical protein
MTDSNIQYMSVAITGFKASFDRVSKIKDPVIKYTMMLEIVRSVLNISSKVSIVEMSEAIEEHENIITEKRMQQDRIGQGNKVRGDNSGKDLSSKILRMEKELNSKKEIVQIFSTLNVNIDEELGQISEYIQGSMSKHEEDDFSDYDD